MRRLLILLALLAFGCKNAAADIPEYGQTGSFSLTDQSGAAHGSEKLRGQVWIAAFMFTRCPTVCPAITARMKALQGQAEARDIAVRFVSFSVDPENDTPEVLAAYAKDNAIDLSSWTFLTGDLEAIKKTSEQGFKSALEGKADPKAADFGITHGSHLILVDRELRLRGFYRSSDDAEMARLIEDAARLAK